MIFVQNSGRNFSVIPMVYFEGENCLLQVYANDSAFWDDCVAKSLALIIRIKLKFHLNFSFFVRTSKYLNTRYLIFSSSYVVILPECTFII